MKEMLAFVTIIITQDTDGMPVGTKYVSTEPVPCVETITEITDVIESMGGKADAFCEYTYAPRKSIRPKARPVD